MYKKNMKPKKGAVLDTSRQNNNKFYIFRRIFNLFSYYGYVRIYVRYG